MPLPSSFPAALLLSDFGYNLPDEKIAHYPLEHRDYAKLLVWKAGHIAEAQYKDLPSLLPDHSLLVFNNSRVLEARILFRKKSGGQVEIFCLEPQESFLPISKAMMQRGQVLWTCLIGGASKWKHGQILIRKIGEIRLEARFVEKRSDDFVVEFSWEPASLPFISVLHQLGSIPLPPYLKRAAETTDAERYQTIYARESGSVAAPTAGLHFSEHLLEKLSAAGMQQLFLTLHVGAGTFMPVKTEKISEHHMHEEFIQVGASELEILISNLHKPVIAVGTTSLRTLETLYWLGLLLSRNTQINAAELWLSQWVPYREPADIPASEALHYLLEWVGKQPGKKLVTKTQLFIVPGYSFKIVRGLITNFHQPHSTLLMLVAALVGSAWKSAYTYALDHEYRFLSYGDGCLFLPASDDSN